MYPYSRILECLYFSNITVVLDIRKSWFGGLDTTCYYCLLTLLIFIKQKNFLYSQTIAQLLPLLNLFPLEVETAKSLVRRHVLCLTKPWYSLFCAGEIDL